MAVSDEIMIEAVRLFNKAKAEGTLRPPRALGSLATGNGVQMVASSPETTPADYIREARLNLKKKTKPRKR